MTIGERLTALRSEMEKRKIDIYIIPTSDFHESEYVGDYFKAREYMTGFTGSAGVAVVTPNEAGLWTDGRYFVQARKQLAGTEIELFPSGNEGVPTVYEFVEANLPEEGTLGFDGRVVNAAAAKRYEQLIHERHGRMAVDEDLVGKIWTDRPPIPLHPVWILPEEYSGESAESKIDRIREKMKKVHANVHIISSLYDIAWILNIRGGDIAHVPVVLAYLLITDHNVDLFIHGEVVDNKVVSYLAECGVRVFEYDTFYETLRDIPVCTVLLDSHLVNYRIRKSLNKHIRIVDAPNPSERMKAIKNDTELKNTRMAHLKDGIAVTKFMYWLKTHVGKETITEYSAGEYLDSLRRSQKNFLDLSFDDICAYGSNAAMMHYQASRENCAELKPEGMLLVDSGGHYLEGTTDITRTFILGPISDQQRLFFTKVAAGNMRLAHAKFLHGCTGINLDILTRGELWQMGIDYKCGTGHGVGHILNVHEGPNGIRWRQVPERKDSGVLEAGMITTDEPGVYIDGEYGIRTENELLCVKKEKNEYGQFLAFENLTYCPIDLDGIDPSLMDESDRVLLNAYHKNVYETLSPYMTEEENEWLKEYTRAI